MRAGWLCLCVGLGVATMAAAARDAVTVVTGPGTGEPHSRSAAVPAPAIGFSSYFGGAASEDLPRLALGPDGSVYLVGTTASRDLPAAVSAAGGRPAASGPGGDTDVFVAKLDPEGAQLDFVTYVGGSAMDRAGGIALAADGSVWLSGQTASPDFPAVRGALSGPADAFVAHLSADGAAVTTALLLGGSGIDSGTGIALGPDGAVYLTGNTASPDFPTASPAQAELGGDSDAFVLRLEIEGGAGAPAWATFLGGAGGNDAGFALALDGAGNVYVVGSTEAPDFPVKTPVQPVFGGAGDAFLAKFTPGGAIEWATTWGGAAADAGLAIAVDAAGAPYVTGQTASADFPTRNPFQQLAGGAADAFVTKIAADGRAVAYSTFLGGSGVDVGGAIAVDGAGNAHVTGMTASPNFPTHDTLQPYFGGGSDVFVVRINDLGSALTYATFSGGVGAEAGVSIAVDGAGNAYVAGQTSSEDFPTYNAVQPEPGGSQDAFVTKYCLSLVFPAQRELASATGRDAFAVTTPAGCVWIAFSQSPWITLTSPNVVAGPGEVQFEVAPNATGEPRAGTLNIGGTEVTVVQAPATDCEYEISPASENFFSQGGVGRINVDTRADCAWSAATAETWISVTGPENGTGPGVVSYTVEANRTGRSRTGTIIVAGQTFVVFDFIR